MSKATSNWLCFRGRLKMLYFSAMLPSIALVSFVLFQCSQDFENNNSFKPTERQTLRKIHAAVEISTIKAIRVVDERFLSVCL